MFNKLIRVAFRLPWHYAVVRRVLLRPSEISLAEARFLGELIRSAPSHLPIIEIGTLFGWSARLISLFKAPETPLITVDSFRWNPHGLTPDQHCRITTDTLEEAIRDYSVTLCEMDKAVFQSSYDGASPGVVFLDANHSYQSTKQDIRWAQRVGAHVICGHDYSSRFPGVIKAVEECGGIENMAGSLWVLRQSR